MTQLTGLEMKPGEPMDPNYVSSKMEDDDLVREALGGDRVAIREFAGARAPRLALNGEAVRAEATLRGLIHVVESADGDEKLTLGRVYYGLGLVFWYTGKYTDAAQVFGSAYECFDFDSPVQRICAANWALALKEAGFDLRDFEDRKVFVESLAQVLEDRGHLKFADRLARGLLSYAMGRSTQAKEDWLGLLKLVGTSHDQGEMLQALRANLNLATIEAEQEDAKKAEQYWGEAERLWGNLEDDAKEPGPLWRDYRLTETDVDMVRERWAAAESALGDLMREYPYDPEPPYRMSALMAKQNKKEDAARWIQKTLSLAPWHPGALLSITGSATESNLSLPRPPRRQEWPKWPKWSKEWPEWLKWPKEWPKWLMFLQWLRGPKKRHGKLGNLLVVLIKISLVLPKTLVVLAKALVVLLEFFVMGGRRFWRLASGFIGTVFRTSIALLLAMTALAFLVYPVLWGESESIETRVVCAGVAIDLTDIEECPPGKLTSTRVTKLESDERPYDIPDSNLAVAAGLGAAALIVFLLPKLIKLKFGGVELELRKASPPTVVSGGSSM